MKSWRSLLPPILLGVALLAVYLRTLAPGLTWANGGADGGDLITAAATGGIPHPTGYPLYLVLARLFQLLPVGTLAYRTNLMSAVFSAAACSLIYAIVVRQRSTARTIHRLLAGLAAGLCFGLSPLAWSQAVITEVYALQSFLVVLLIYMYTGPFPEKSARRAGMLDGCRGLILGLALGNHLTSLLLLPLLLLLGTIQPSSPGNHQSGRGFWRQRYDLSLPALGRQILGLALGLSVYLILPLRASNHPPVNWGDPVSWNSFTWLVTGRLYQSYYLQADFSHIFENVQDWARFSLAQIGLIGVFLALLGLVVFGRLSRLLILTSGIAIATLAFSSMYHPADAEIYLLPLLVSFSIWLGIGLGGLQDFLFRYSPVLAVVIGLLVIGLLLFRSLSTFPRVDASGDSQAEDFARQVLAAAPRDAILFAEGDRAIFALWYFHYALHERPDLVVIARELVPYDWYAQGLRDTYPALVLPGPIVYPETIRSANLLRPACQIRSIDRPEIECENAPPPIP